MRVFYIRIKYPTTTISEHKIIYFSVKDIKSNDAVLYNLILSYDFYLNRFSQHQKPFWKYPPLPEDI